MPRGPLVGVGGAAEFGLVLIGQLGEELFCRGDVSDEGIQGSLRVGQADGGQPVGFGLQLACGGGETPRVGFHAGHVGGDLEARALQPGRTVGNALDGSAQLGPDRLGPFTGGRGLGVGVLLLLAGHALALELAQLRVVERAADGARRAVDQGRRELGAHAVDASLTQPQRLVAEIDVLKLRGDVGLRLAGHIRSRLDQCGRIVRSPLVTVRLGLDAGQSFGGLPGLVPLEAQRWVLLTPGGGGLLGLVDVRGQRDRSSTGRSGGFVLLGRLVPEGAQAFKPAGVRHVPLGVGAQFGGGGLRAGVR